MKTLKQFSKYGGVAAGSAVSDYTVFSLLLIFGTGTLPAQMAARVAGGVFSFLMNKYWSFEVTSVGSIKKEGRRFLMLYGFSYVLALVILFLLTEKAEFAVYPAKISTDTSCFVVNFLVMRSYVFGGGRGVRYALNRFFNLGRKTPKT